MGPIGFQEVVVILLLALIFLGPKKLPELASGIGKAIREVRKATADIKQEIELDEIIRKPLEELREATMLPPEELKRRDEDRKWRDRMEKEEKERLAREAENGVTDASTAPEGSESYGEYHDPQLEPDLSATVSDLSSSSSSASDPAGHKAGAQDAEAGSLSSGASTVGAALSATAQTPVPTSAQSSAQSATKAPSAESAGGGDDRTIAMNLPPPMAGAGSAALPPPKPAPVRRATPPPVPPAALKSGSDSSGVPTGAVPRVPSGTLIGMLPVAIKPVDQQPAAPAPPPVEAPSTTPAASASTPAESIAVGKSGSKPSSIKAAGKAPKKV